MVVETMTNPRIQKGKKYFRFLFFGILFITAGLVLFALAVYIYAKILGPPPLAVPQSTLYYSNDGSIIGESNSGQKRYWVPLRSVSKEIVNATISIEDKNFYHHHGFDIKRIGGALLADAIAMHKVQGASTITQQYAKNLFLTMDKTWTRKISEALYTIRLEMNYSKDKILEGYLNTINYGHGAYGIQAASQYYFGKDADQLDLAEAAMLVGIPKGPSIYSPINSLEKAKNRQLLVLNSMKENGYITEKDVKSAAQEKITIVGKHAYHRSELAPYFQDIVRHQLKTALGLSDRTIQLGGLRVYTTLDTKQQQIADDVIKESIAEDSDIQVGFTAMDPKTGFVTALVGGRNYDESPYDRAVQASRQPGSTIKPLLYYAALEKGFTPTTMMRSEPTTFQFDNGNAKYTPHNFNDQYADGEITMAQALALSDNVYAVKTHLFLGENTLVRTAKDFGITTKMAKVPSLALGTSGVHVIDMVGAYSMLANGGKKADPVFITRVEDYQGNVLYEYKPQNEQVLRPDLAYVMTQMMTGMFDKKLNGYASVTGSTIINQLTRQYAGKSGSTNTDSWMIGFTPQLTAGVWTGYDKGNEITLAADKRYAKTIWARFMEKSLKGEPIKTFKAPKGVVSLPIDPKSGKVATKNCPISREMYFVKGTEPNEYCDLHPGKGEKRLPKQKEKPKQDGWLHKLFNWL